MWIVRKLNRLATWASCVDDPAWIAEDDCPGIVLRDFNPDTAGVLSVWVVPSPEDRNSIARLAAALAAAENKSIENFDYAIGRVDSVEKEGFEFSTTAGNTLDPEVNSWHRDITGVTGRGMIRLARCFHAAGNETNPDRLYKREIVQALRGLVEKHTIKRTVLPDKVAKSLE